MEEEQKVILRFAFRKARSLSQVELSNEQWTNIRFHLIRDLYFITQLPNHPEISLNGKNISHIEWEKEKPQRKFFRFNEASKSCTKIDSLVLHTVPRKSTVTVSL